jgi:hypothetical protein
MALEPRMAQLIAVAGSTKEETRARLAQLEHIARTPALFDGHEQVYVNLYPDTRPNEPGTSQKVRATAAMLLEAARLQMTANMDLVRTLDDANTAAFADVEVPGPDGEPVVLLEHVPVGHMLWLVRETEALITLVSSLPELNPGQDWTPADNGLSKYGPLKSFRTEKIPGDVQIVVPASDRFPAQTRELPAKDIEIGERHKTIFCGAVDPERKRVLLERLGNLRDGLRKAREEANSARVTSKHEGKVIFDYLWAE